MLKLLRNYCSNRRRSARRPRER